MLSYDAVENQNNFSQVEKAVLRAKKEWEATFDAIPDMLFLTNSDGRIVRYNQTAEVKFRGICGELSGRKLRELVPGVQFINGIELQLFEDKRWYRIYNLPVTMGDELLYHFFSFQDVTRKKTYELEILREEQYYEALFKTFPESLAVLDAQGIVREINPVFEQTFGFQNAEARGRSIQSLLTAREFRVAGKPLNQISDTAEQAGTYRCTSKEGKAITFSIRELPITHNGIDHGRLAIFHKVLTLTELPVTENTDHSARDVLLTRIEGRILPLIQCIDELNLSLENDVLSTKQITLKNAVDVQVSLLRRLVGEMHTHEPENRHVAKDSAKSPVGSTYQFNERPSISSTSSIPMVPKNQPRILLVEDNPINQKLMLRLLQKRGFQVTVADNGIAALRALAKQSFTLIFMDIQMPEMDGIETTRRIRVREHDGQHQVIIALTAEGPGGDRMECLRAGMDDYLAKPVNIDELFELLEKYAAAAMPSSYEVPEAVAPKIPLESETINVMAALPRFGGEVDVYFDFLNHFIKQLKQTDQKMRSAYKNGDIEQLHAISHGLKGTAANFEVKSICDLANMLEQITCNNSLVGAFSLINQISAEIPPMETFYHNQMQQRKKKSQLLSAGAGA